MLVTRVALVGQPNCGKSTIFNHLVGYKATTSNFPGTTVEYLSSEAWIAGRHVEVVDLPGTYSLLSADAAEAVTRDYLLRGGVGSILNVIDASLLSRSLELTLQLLETGIPLVVCLNMEDEAKRKGMTIRTDDLSRRLGVPVVSAVAVRGVGVKEAASLALEAAERGASPPPPVYGPDVEGAIATIAFEVERSAMASRRSRLTATRLLEGDLAMGAEADRENRGLTRAVEEAEAKLRMCRGRSGDEVLSAERHHTAMALSEAVSTLGTPRVGLRDRLDTVVMHPVMGYLVFLGVLYAFFTFVFQVGGLVERPVLSLFDRAVGALASVLPQGTRAFTVLRGLIQGIAGATGLALPYLVPFLLGLALLEDVGYLPRVGYLLDGLMHRIGLHGKSVIPFILGYGCSVPAVMATRILESPRDRFITAALAIMVPCVARTTVVFGLVAFFLGPLLAVVIYLVNLVVIALAGKVLTRLWPQVTPGLILEIPPYRVPSPRAVAGKVWLRVREFLLFAWPLLIGGSVVLALLEYAHVDRYLNLALAPVTWPLGLPAALGVPLVFGVLRKELSLLMVFQALGTTDVRAVLSPGQILTFTLFLLFYVPCLATIAVLWREFGRRKTFLLVLGTTGIALLVGLLVRGIAALAS